MKKCFLPILFIAAIACKTSRPPQEDWRLGPFIKPAENPLLTADSSFVFNDPLQQRMVQWQKADVFNPAAIVRNDTVFLLFRAEDNPAAGIGGRTSRIGLAYSTDGLHFTKYEKPVLYPDSSAFMQFDLHGGCEDPRVVELENGSYLMMYTSWDTKVARLSVATSNDLYHWQKQGPAFATTMNGKYRDLWSKSGSIVTALDSASKKLVATKIKGRYWMYYGDVAVTVATSENGISWSPVENAKGVLVKALQPRPGKFDSELAEPGPPALLTKNGILLLYNGKNVKGPDKDSSLAPGTYAAGQALFAEEDPARLIIQTDTCFLQPTLPHERAGQYAAGTTFIEGLVFFKGRWFLYYGTADSMVGVAVF